MKILSICIPTYNRCDSLCKLLDSIEAGYPAIKNSVEILISNNASTDDTESVIEEYKEKLCLICFTNKENIGGSKNILKLLGQANTPYAVLVGDDDLVDIDAIKKLINFLISQNTDDIWFYVSNIKIGLGGLSCIKNIELLANGLENSGFIGNHIIPRAAVLQIAKMDEFDKIGWPHVSLFLMHVNRGLKFQSCNISIVVQSGAGVLVNWQPWQIISLLVKRNSSTLVLLNKRNVLKWLVFFRSIYSPKQLGLFVYFKLFDPAKYKETYLSYIYKIDTCFPLAFALLLPYRLWLSFVAVVPSKLLLSLMPKKIREKIVILIERNDTVDPSTNGIDRGL